jgi:hypothetical protein
MVEPTPIELLISKVAEFKHDLEKSEEMFHKKGEIDLNTHLKHHTNLERLILQYTNALTILKNAESN